MKLTLELFVATALWAVNESIEMPFFRGLDEHFFALQTIFGVLHVRCGNVCLKTRFIPPFHVQQKKRWIIRALGPVVDLASFFIETWRCDLCDDLFHRFDCVSASVKFRGDNVRMESHKFDGHTQVKRRLGAFKVCRTSCYKQCNRLHRALQPLK